MVAERSLAGNNKVSLRKIVCMMLSRRSIVFELDGGVLEGFERDSCLD